jgi:ABC-type bacteriocin/lantibiotic exporter with double-glycine peptidase domain
MLLAIVSLYTGAENRLLYLLPQFARDAQSLFPVLCLLFLFGMKTLSSYWVFRTQSRFFFGISSRLSHRELFHYLDGSYEAYIRSDRAQLLNAVNHRPIEFAQNILSSIQTVFTESALIVITIIAIIIFKPALFLLLILFLLPSVIIAALLIRKKINHVKQHISSDAEKTTQYLNEAFSSFIESNIYDKKAFFADRHLTFQKKLSTHVSQLQIIQWIPSRLVELFAVLGLFALVLFNKLLGQQSGLLDIAAFIAAAYKIMPGIVRIANASAILKTYHHVVAGLGGKKEEGEKKTYPSLQKIDSIHFREVSFGYTESPVLSHINASWQSGDFIFVSGPSGKGKTTFIHLLLGFLAPKEGAILFNDTAMTQECIKGAYPRISYVKQQTVLIQDTIQNNITMEEEHADEKRLQLAVEFAGLTPFVDTLKNGLQTILSDEGRDISGGQKQRIAIARAVYRDADLFVFDEPFNELDKQSESVLLGHLKKLAESGKIVVLISHHNLGLDYCNKQFSFDY